MIGKLKIAWDLYFSKHPKLILVLCGSISPWIEKNILSSTGFFGRISLTITLKELHLESSLVLLQAVGFRGSSKEQLLLLSILGGIPWYIEQIIPDLPALENIKRLCFAADGILVDEYNKIFNDLFNRRKIICGNIIAVLADGPKTYQEITNILKYRSSGALSAYLADLLAADFICQDHNWSFVTKKILQKSRYRLQDNYLRFYLKYIAPNKEKIIKDKFTDNSLSAMPGWHSIIGLQFENIVLSNPNLMCKLLNIELIDIVNDGPYFKPGNKTSPGCQIDYLIQTKMNTLYVCEIKFLDLTISNTIVEDLERKIQALKVPRKFTCLPVLIYIGEASQSLLDLQYFYRVIDLAQYNTR